MNNPELLSPALLNATAMLVVATSALMIAAHAILLALAARRAELSPAIQYRAPLWAAAFLAVWFSWAVLVVKEPVIAPEPPPVAGLFALQPALLLTMAGFMTMGIVVLFTSKTVRAINAATPPAWLIGVQTYRVAGAMFLWPYLAAGALPAGFAIPAGIGDMITGLAAPLVAWAVARNRPGAGAWAMAWNLFGILDLAVAPAAAVLSHSTNVARFPLVVVPLFLGPPLGILTHIYSLRNLAVNRARTGDRGVDRATDRSEAAGIGRAGGGGNLGVSRAD